MHFPGTSSYEPQVGEFPHLAGPNRPRTPPFSSPFCWSCRCIGRFLIRGWDLVLLGWRWLYEPQIGGSTPCRALSTQGGTVFVPGLLELWICGRVSGPGMGSCSAPGGASSTNLKFGFPCRAGRYRPGGPPFSSTVCWNCRYTEGFMIRGCYHILPHWCWLYNPQVGVSTPCGAVSTRGTTAFVPGLLEL